MQNSCFTMHKLVLLKITKRIAQTASNCFNVSQKSHFSAKCTNKRENKKQRQKTYFTVCHYIFFISLWKKGFHLWSAETSPTLLSRICRWIYVLNYIYYDAKHLEGGRRNENSHTYKTTELFFNNDSKHLPDKNNNCATDIFKKETNKNYKPHFYPIHNPTQSIQLVIHIWRHARKKLC